MGDAPKNEHIELAIKLAGGSQEALGKILGCVQQHVSKMLNGETPISGDIAIKLEGKWPRYFRAREIRRDLVAREAQSDAQVSQ